MFVPGTAPFGGCQALLWMHGGAGIPCRSFRDRDRRGNRRERSDRLERRAGRRHRPNFLPPTTPTPIAEANVPPARQAPQRMGSQRRAVSSRMRLRSWTRQGPRGSSSRCTTWSPRCSGSSRREDIADMVAVQVVCGIHAAEADAAHDALTPPARIAPGRRRPMPLARASTSPWQGLGRHQHAYQHPAISASSSSAISPARMRRQRSAR